MRLIMMRLVRAVSLMSEDELDEVCDLGQAGER